MFRLVIEALLHGLPGDIEKAIFSAALQHSIKVTPEKLTDAITATLDILSRGRLVVGLGRGNRPQEFLGHGVNQDASRTLLQEGLEVLRQAWTQERVEHHGRFWRIPGTAVYPRPLTRPDLVHPRHWINEERKLP